MEFLIPMIVSLFGGLFSGGIRQSQQNQQARAEAEAERERARVQSELAEQRRAQIQEEIDGYVAELDAFRERVHRGAEYSGLESGVSREATRNLQSAQAAAAAQGVSDSGQMQSQAQAILADAIGQTAMARLQDQMQREQLIGSQEQQLRQLVANMLQDPAFRVGTPEQQQAGIDELLAGVPGAGGSALAGGIGAVLPLIAQWGLGALGERFGDGDGTTTDDVATAADAATPGTTPLPNPMFGYQVPPTPSFFNGASWLANTNVNRLPWGGSPQRLYEGN